MCVGRVLTLLILLTMALQTSVVAIMFSKKDSTWIEAIAAVLGVVSNTAAIYLGFSANICKSSCVHACNVTLAFKLSLGLSQECKLENQPRANSTHSNVTNIPPPCKCNP